MLDHELSREIGRMEADIDTLKKTVARMETKIDLMADTIANARGGWKMISIIIAVTSGLTLIVERLVGTFR